MTSSDIRPGEPSLSGAPQLAVRLVLPCLILLIAFLPITRVAAQFLLPSGGATAMARLHVGVMECMVIAAVFADRRVAIPSLGILPKAMLLLMGAWLGWSLFAIAQSAVPGMAMARQVEWLTHAAFGWAVWAFLRTCPQHVETILRWLVRGFLIYVLLLAFFLLKLPHPEDYPWVHGILGFANVRHFGYYAAVVLVAAHASLLKDASRMQRFGDLAVLAVIWAVVAWSGSRGPIYAVFGSLAILTVFRALPHARRIWGLTLCAAVTGALVSIPFTPPSGSFGIIRFAETVQQADSMAGYSAGRTDFWRMALGLVRDHPIFGLGPDQLLVGGVAGHFYTFVQPHDLMLQAALEWGIPGALMVLALMGLILLAGLRRAKSPQAASHQVIGLWIAGMLTALALIDGTYYHALPLMALALGLALTFTPAKSAPSTGTPRHPIDLTILAGSCALLTLLSAVAMSAILASSTPAPGSWREHLVRAYASPLALLGGGALLDNWARAWAPTDQAAAYDLLDWTAQHSRMPWTSQDTRARMMIEAGDVLAGQRLLEAAQARELAITGQIGALSQDEN